MYIEERWNDESERQLGEGVIKKRRKSERER